MASLNDPKIKKATFPAITVEDLDGETLVVATIESIELTDFGGGDAAIVATYEEFEGKKHRLNATGRKRLEAGFGTDDTDKMIGKTISLEVTKQPNPQKGGEISKVVWIADPTDWPQAKKAAKRKR